MVPVLAWTFPRAGGVRMRSWSVPLMPAIGRAAVKYGRTSGSAQAARRMPASARVVSRSSDERPEPSTSRTPAIGTPASTSVDRTIAAPPAAVPGCPLSAPICLRSISAVKLSLTRPIQATICESGGDWTDASTESLSRAVPRPAPPTETPTWRSALRKSSAPASAGSRDVRPW